MRRSLLVALACASCDGTVTQECEPNTPPTAPAILSPAYGRVDVVSTGMVISTSAFLDANAEDVHGATEVEIWSVVDGEAVQRVWSAVVEGAVTEVALADGTFDWGSDLEEWTDYAIRARHRDDRALCSAWSEWSEETRFKTDDGSTYLFDPTVVRDFYLTIPPESWGPINAQAFPPGCVPFHRDYYTGTLEFEGETYAGVGIHIKGGCGSSRDLGGKASFKVNIDWDDPALPGCPSTRRLRGQKHLTLNNGVQDWTAGHHERLGYQLYQELGVPAARAASARVFVNGELWGLYTHVETIDRRFLDRWFDSNQGMLYEGTYWCDLISSNVPPTTDDSYCLTREFSPDACDGALDPGADPMDYETLRTFVQQLEALPQGDIYPAIESFFEMDRFFTSWAIESQIAHWDGYQFRIMNNYRIYHDPATDRWTLISSGIDQTFRGDQDPWDVDGTIAARCIQEPDCNAAFAARLAEVNARFASAGLAARAQAIHDQITPHVIADPRKEYTTGDYDAAYTELLDFIATRTQRVGEHLTAHGF